MPSRPNAVSGETRLWSQIRRGEDGACWPTEAAKTRDGYGRVQIGGRRQMAHRWVV